MTANENKVTFFFGASKDDDTEITSSTPKVAENAANKINFTSSGEETPEIKSVKTSISRYTKFAYYFFQATFFLIRITFKMITIFIYQFSNKKWC
jgi:hypothetical protein